MAAKNQVQAAWNRLTSQGIDQDHAMAFFNVSTAKELFTCFAEVVSEYVLSDNEAFKTVDNRGKTQSLGLIQRSEKYADVLAREIASEQDISLVEIKKGSTGTRQSSYDKLAEASADFIESMLG